MGLAYHQNGNAAAAMKALKRAVALRPDLPGASYNLGTVLRVAGRNDEALPYFRQALQQNPRDFEAHNNLAGVLTALNRKSDAIAHFKAAIGSNRATRQRIST